MAFDTILKLHRAVHESVSAKIVGKARVTDLAIITLLCGGHMLLDDVPGTGKTVFAKQLASALSLEFGRVQCVPDMLPSDLIGVNFFDMKLSEFRFVRGPVFTGVLLADEINRAMPKTQSGLLECMEERQVSVDGVTYPLDDPFFVIATQNPVETKGTFDLPEAQLDRFLVKTSMGYPAHDESVEILKRKFMAKPESKELSRVSRETILLAKEELKSVYVHDDILHYATSLCEATRQGKDILLGAGPRALIGLVAVARGFAAIAGRDYVLPDDVKTAAVPVLAHRLVFQNSLFRQKDMGQARIEELLETLPVPSEQIDFRRRG